MTLYRFVCADLQKLENLHSYPACVYARLSKNRKTAPISNLYLCSGIQEPKKVHVHHCFLKHSEIGKTTLTSNLCLCTDIQKLETLIEIKLVWVSGIWEKLGLYAHRHPGIEEKTKTTFI